MPIFFQKEIINSLKFDQLNYSLLHIAVLNNWQELVVYLINKWPVDIEYKDSSGNSAWNHACMLLQKDNALKIKNHVQLIEEDKKFLKEIMPSSPNWNLIAQKETEQLASKTRTEIFDFYMSPTIIETGIDTLKFFKDIINDLDSHQPSINNIPYSSGHWIPFSLNFCSTASNFSFFSISLILFLFSLKISMKSLSDKLFNISFTLFLFINFNFNIKNNI